MELTSRLQDRDTSRAKFQVRLEFLQFQIPSMQEQDAGERALLAKLQILSDSKGDMTILVLPKCKAGSDV